MGGEPLLLAFIVVIIGGLGSLRGTVAAAVLIGMSDGIISVFFSPTLAKILATLLARMVKNLRIYYLRKIRTINTRSSIVIISSKTNLIIYYKMYCSSRSIPLQF